MSIRTQYTERVKDLENHYELLVFLDQIETYKTVKVESIQGTQKKSLLINTNLQQCMRAQCVMLLYNLIESTIFHCIQAICDSIEDENLMLNDVTDKLRKIWISSTFPSNLGIPKVRNKIESLVNEINATQITFTPDSITNISGNIDLRHIRTIAEMLGIRIDSTSEFMIVGNILLNIKEKRNQLAHGEKSFSNIGSLLVINDLIAYKENTIKFLEYIIEIFEDFIEKKSYKKVSTSSL